ncbi:hypothetical protein [Nocardia sp. XZ_19_369]|uniref:hypothetical protein n=1 Tax=Nocardia sp. XZ_19_369 TaxID=2769487 RepID=UPI00188FF1B2|nr:hypothetical protein [Nocardia sp. XZ_19_369]
MPSPFLELFIDLFRQRPQLAAELLTTVLDNEVPQPANTCLEGPMRNRVHKFYAPFSRFFYAWGQTDALLVILESRGLLVSSESRALAKACASLCHLDIDYLDMFLRRAASAASVEEVFAGHLPDQELFADAE